MSIPDKTTTILIVGAGPAGLAAALSLLHYGCHDFIITDAVPRGENSSRAFVLHAATLEALDTLGCGDDLVCRGTKTTAFDIGTRSTTLCSPNVDSLKSYTRHPYILVIPQNVMECTLEQKLASLGVKIHRPLKVVDLRRNGDNPQLSDVIFDDGRVITAKYVIGADGARSTVRIKAGISFSDPTATEGEEDNNVAHMVLADVMFNHGSLGDFAPSETMSSDSFFHCFPFPSSFNEALAADGKTVTSDRIYRIACGVSLTDGEVPDPPSQEYLQKLVDRFGPFNLSSDPSVNPNHEPTLIKEVIWGSHIQNRASIADTPFTRLGSRESRDEGGAVLLIGDAAHLYSIAGAQGINLAMRDGAFVGEAVVKHNDASKYQPLSEADAILREFATTRHARALEVIKFTKSILSISGMKHRAQLSWWCPIDSTTVREWAVWVLGNIPFVQSKIAYELSGLGRK